MRPSHFENEACPASSTISLHVRTGTVAAWFNSYGSPDRPVRVGLANGGCIVLAESGRLIWVALANRYRSNSVVGFCNRS